MMRIAIAKIDKKGRLQLPSNFLSANLITSGTRVYIDIVYNSQNSCKLTFVNPLNKENQNDDRK